MQKASFRIGVLQMRARGKNAAENTELGLAQMEKAALGGADLLLFPECFLTGYSFPVRETVDRQSPYLAAFCAKAASLSVGAAVTAFTSGKTSPRNSAYVIDKGGRVLMRYDKVHTCDFAEESCLESGDEFKVCDFHGVKIGVMICYDREYPESARVLMLKGAEIILVPNDCRVMPPRVNALATRAYENMTGVAMANPPGKDAGLSCAFSPIPWTEDGTLRDMSLFTADETSEGIFYADYDLDALRQYRSTEMMGNTFRKPAAYALLVERGVKEPFLRKRGTAGKDE